MIEFKNMSSQDRKLFLQIYELFGQQKFREAEDMLVRVLETAPRNALVHSLLALGRSSGGRAAEALDSARRGVELAPRLGFTHYVLASVLDDLQQLHEALISIREAIRLQPEEVAFYSQLALIYLQQEKWADAVATATRGLELDVDHVDCRNIRRQALTMYENAHGESVTRTADTMRRISMNASVSADRGWVELCNRNFEQARFHFGEALLLEPEHPRAQLGMLRLIRRKRPVLGALLGMLAVCQGMGRIGITFCLALLAAAGVFIWRGGHFPISLLTLLPGLFGLLPFLLARLLLTRLLRPRLIPSRPVE